MNVTNARDLVSMLVQSTYPISKAVLHRWPFTSAWRRKINHLYVEMKANLMLASWLRAYKAQFGLNEPMLLPLDHYYSSRPWCHAWRRL